MSLIPLEHQRSILAVERTMSTPRAGQSVVDFPLEHGFTEYTTGFPVFCEVAQGHYLFAQRARLEKDEDRRQPLMYTPVVIPAEDHKSFQLAVYQRKGKNGEKVGEIRMQDGFSIGFGGHSDQLDTAWRTEGVPCIEGTLDKTWAREKGEEFSLRVTTGRHSHRAAKEQSRFAGFLIDETPTSAKQRAAGKTAVGLHHVGLVKYVIAEPGSEVVIGETENTLFKPQTPQELLASGLAFEPWSQMLIEWFATKTMPELLRPGMYCEADGAGVDSPKLFETSIKL